MISEQTPPSFDEASRRFSKFLRQNGSPEQVAWVEQADVLWDTHRLCVCVRSRSPQVARDQAYQRYAAGIRNGVGVELHAFAELPERSVAAIILPKDDDAAQRHLIAPGGLKLCLATKKLPARSITNRLTWLILSVRHRTASQSFWDAYLECS